MYWNLLLLALCYVMHLHAIELTSNPRSINSCDFETLITKEDLNTYYGLSSSFIELVNETGFNERKGYLLKLIFIVENNSKGKKITGYKLVDSRTSLVDKKRFEKKSKKLFKDLLPEYLKLIDESEVTTDCQVIIFKLQLRLCY